MKNLQLLIWLTELGLSAVAPLVGFVLLAVWLKNRFALGNWVLLLGIGFGLVNAVSSLCKSLRTLGKLSGKDRQETEKQAQSFNDHD